MIAKKATSTPLNPKSQAQNQGKEDWVQKQYLVFLVKREESRDVFFFWSVFGILLLLLLLFGREKKTQRGTRQRVNFIKKCMSPQSDGCLRLFIALSAFFEVAFFAFFKPPLIRLILTPLDRSSFSVSKKYGTQKSNNQIKRYGSRKFALQRSILHPSFCDISTVLTPISTYEQSLK